MNETRVYNRRLSPERIDHYAYGYVYDVHSETYVLPDELEETNYVVYLDGIQEMGRLTLSQAICFDLIRLYIRTISSARLLRNLRFLQCASTMEKQLIMALAGCCKTVLKRADCQPQRRMARLFDDDDPIYRSS